MKARIQAWAKRNRLAVAIILNLVMIATTALFTLIALGPSSLLEEDCSGMRSGSCFESHGAAALWAVLSGVVTALFLGGTLWALKTGRFRELDQTEDSERPTSDSASTGAG